MSLLSWKSILLLFMSMLIACSPRGPDENIARDEAKDSGSGDTDLLIRFVDVDPGVIDVDGLGVSDAAIRQRLVEHEFGLLEDLPAAGEKIGIELFDGVTVVAEISQVERTESDQVHITASYPDEPFGVFWLRESSIGLIGTIQTQGKFFDLFPVEPGVVRITEFDQSRFPPDRDMGDRSGSSRDFRLERFMPRELLENGKPPTIRVMVLFPTPTYGQYCSQRSMIAIADAIRDEINKVWRAAARSEVVALCIPYDPRGKDLVDYIQNGGDWRNYESDTGESVDVDYNWLKADTTVAALRDRERADLVAMFLPVYHWCGGALTNDPPVTSADAGNAYAVVKLDCARGNYSLQHELGHLVGMRHDRLAESSDIAENCNYGYVCRQGTTTVGRTIMAYRSSCQSAGGTPQQCKTRFPSYSVARTVLDVFGATASTCGRPCGGTSTSLMTGSADNFRQLLSAASTVSQFR